MVVVVSTAGTGDKLSALRIFTRKRKFLLFGELFLGIIIILLNNRLLRVEQNELHQSFSL